MDDISDDSGFDEIVTWVQSLVEDAVVGWFDHHLVIADVHTGWVDVSVNDGPDMSWLWTIESVDANGDNSDDKTIMALAYDRTQWAVWDNDAMWILEEPAFSSPYRRSLTIGQLDEIEAAIAEHPERRNVCETGAWSFEAVNTALRNWCLLHAGRGDVKFVFAPEQSPGLDPVLLDRVESFKDGTMDTYQLAEGVEVTDEVMDFLLAMDPDDAAEFTGQIAKTFEGLKRKLEDTPPNEGG